MSTIADFNRIEKCDMIDARCIEAYIEASLNDEKPEIFQLRTSWGDTDIDLTPAVKAAETLTTLYLSPVGNPNCLVYVPERGDNVCITGDELSRIISMTKLKDVDQNNAIYGGAVYMYNASSNLFSPFNLRGFVDKTEAAITNLDGRMSAAERNISSLGSRMATAENNIADLQGRMATAEGNITNLLARMTTAEGDITDLKSRMTTAEGNITSLKSRMTTAEGNITTLQNTVANHETRIAAIEAILAKPANAPSNIGVAWSNINLYSDPNAAINDSGATTSLDKTHGIYSHNLNNNAYGDEIMG